MLTSLDNSLLNNETIILERESGINNLARDVEQVSDLFSDLALLVQCQGDHLDNIETNISNSSNNIEGANRQLIKANNYKKAKYRCTCRCIFFLFILLLILVFVFVIKLSIKK
tara:strand:- start:807 stop:1145 length:339 start_codon:yes stop_codon:yes gene_type:complete